MPRQNKKNSTKPKKGKSCKKPKHKTKDKAVKKVTRGGHTQKVSFNLRKNHVEKYYCPDLSIEDESPSLAGGSTGGSIDLNSIQEFPEIPLTDLLNSH